MSNIKSKNNFLSPIALLLSRNQHLLDDIPAYIVSDQKDTTARGIAGSGICSITHENNILSPVIKIQHTHKNNYSILLHELVHGITHPYLYAGSILRLNNNIDIVDPVLKKAVLQHYDTICDIYNEANKKGYSVINGESIEHCIIEFCANITNKKSTEQLKKIGLYDKLINEIQRHVDSISTLKIPLITKDGSPIVRKTE